jgi:thiol-disulfide isomerase/thioredoxin
MKRVTLVFCILWIAALFISCGGSTTSVNPNPDRNGSFNLTLDQGVGSFTPEIDVATDATGTTVTVTASDATDLAAAYLHLHYDASKYTPDSVQIGSLLGTGDQVITLALTDRVGDVPVGICQVPSNGATPVDGSGILASIHFVEQPFSAGKGVSGAPTDVLNKVSDLEIKDQDATSTTLTWTERHPGDTDNNGEVNLSDLTQIGKYLNQQVAQASDQDQATLADCDGNGEVNVTELTTLGKNLGSVLDGYKVFTDAAGTQAANNGELFPRTNFYFPDTAKYKQVEYEVIIDVATGGGVEFHVAPGSTAAPTAATPLSEAAVDNSIPGPPADPSNLQAFGSDVIGAGRIKLTWVPSPSTDTRKYIIERQTTTPASGFQPVATIDAYNGPLQVASYFDNDATLSNQSYDYRLTAQDIKGEISAAAGPASATPYFPPPPATPTGVVAITHPAIGQAIKVNWDLPAGVVQKFNVYRQGPGEPSFTLVKTTQNSGVLQFDDTGLTALTDYSYYVTTLNAAGESAPSTTVTAQSSDMAQIVITNVDFDKTTHVNDGSEPAANITVTTDQPATSYSATGPGVFTSNATGGTWKPNGSTPLGKVTVSITAHKGLAQSAAVDVEFFVTDQAILPQFGNAGAFIPWSDRASMQAPSAPFIPVMDYLDGDHVCIMNIWGTWCGPCRQELPEMDQWATYYGGGGNYHHVSMNGGGSDTLQMAIDFFASYNYNDFSDNYFPADQSLWAAEYGFQGWPTTILVDRDGMIRLQICGWIGYNPADPPLWSKTIADCCGMAPMP